jgi:hypothetical protein
MPKPYRLLLAGLLMLAATLPARAAPFDHTHAAWNQLLQEHVVAGAASGTSRVDYASMAKDRRSLQDYLASLSAVPRSEYAAWSKPQQLAFLINAYNAFTVELILTAYPKLDSIKDLGTLFQSPWKKRFFTLLGEKRHLDDIEHGMIRAPGVFDEPRIHVAVVCAAISCPKLRNEAWVAERLDTQFEAAMKDFLGDSSRNRYDASTGMVHLSKIFDWYQQDFQQGHRGFDSLQGMVRRYAAELAPNAEDRHRLLSAATAPIVFNDYDRRLNDAARP